MKNDAWNVAQYEEFKGQRARPFYDLVCLIKSKDAPLVVDLGCGTGELTAQLHRALGAAVTLGVDNSESMLAEAHKFKSGQVKFKLGAIETLDSEKFDVIFANASLQWLPHHQELLKNLASKLTPMGQIAIQVPANHNHASHRIADLVAREEPFKTYLQSYCRTYSVLEPEEYAKILFELGFKEQVVRLQIYENILVSTSDVVEWVKGTLLTDYEKRLTPDQYAEFLKRYREMLLRDLGVQSPYFYAFKRILLWGQK